MRVILIGYKGKMGQIMQEVLKKNAIDFIGIDKDFNYKMKEIDGDVIIDFSSSIALENNLKLAKIKKIPIIIATTGHNQQNFDKIKKFSKNLPVFISSNLSIGFNYLLKCLDNIELIKDYYFTISETHHKYKKDSPSGSAIEIKNKLEKYKIEPKIFSTRAGEIIGEHIIKIIGDYETIEIKHTALNRKVFCLGALKACNFIITKKYGLFTMEDLIKNDCL